MMRRLVPRSIRQTIRRYRHAHAIRNGRFGDSDPLFQCLPDWVHEGSVAVDIGAAVGTYTVALSELVGPTGRVIALEPMPDQFEILASNLAGRANVTCLQLAASDATMTAHMSVPDWRGVPNWYEAHIAEDGLPILCAALDSLPIPRPVRFLKIDCEGHDFAVLKGAERIVTEDKPVIFIESASDVIATWLFRRGYRAPIFADEGVNRIYAPHVQPGSEV